MRPEWRTAGALQKRCRTRILRSLNRWDIGFSEYQVMENQRKKGPDVLRRGLKTMEIALPIKGQPLFRNGTYSAFIFQ